MDWNWFFSSVAQSAAAIVGIFGAFIITKVIGNQSEFVKKSKLLDELIVTSETFKEEADNCRFDWYNKRKLENELQEIEENFTTEEPVPSPKEYYEQYDFSPYQKKEEILTEIKEKRDNYLKAKEKEEREIRERLAKSPGKGIATYDTLTYRDNLLMDSELAGMINNTQEQIENLILRINQHCRHSCNFIKDNCANPESSPLINKTLLLTVILFFAGVIYPLSFLPLQVNSEINLSLPAFWDMLFSIKGVILIIISLAFMAIVATFIYINSNLKYDKLKMKELKKFSLLSEYSIYLKNMEENANN